MMLAGLYLQPRPGRILVIGLGGGTIPKTLRLLYPQARIDVAELDPAVVAVARRFFGFQSGGTMRVIEQDGRVFVKRQVAARAKYDMVMLDAFDGDYIPEHMLRGVSEGSALYQAPGDHRREHLLDERPLPDESATYLLCRPFFNRRAAACRAKVGDLPGDSRITKTRRRWTGIGGNSAHHVLLPKMTQNWNLARVLTTNISTIPMRAKNFLRAQNQLWPLSICAACC